MNFLDKISHDRAHTDMFIHIELFTMDLLFHDTLIMFLADMAETWYLLIQVKLHNLLGTHNYAI